MSKRFAGIVNASAPIASLASMHTLDIKVK